MGKQLLKAIEMLLQYDVLLMMKAEIFFSSFQQSLATLLKGAQTTGAPPRSIKYQGEELLQVCGAETESSHA